MSFAIIGISVGAIGLGASIYNGIQQNSNAQAEMQQQQTNQNQELQQAQTQENNQESENDANQQRNQQEQVLSAMGLGKQGWAGTILTSPLGVPGNNSGGTSGAKTILGQ